MKSTPKKPFPRKVHIDQKEWSYRFIVSQKQVGYLHIRDPKGIKQYRFELKKVGHDLSYCCEFHCELESGTFVHEVTPEDVKRIIQKRVLGQKIDRENKPQNYRKICFKE
jgi:hypothetical protein